MRESLNDPIWTIKNGLPSGEQPKMARLDTGALSRVDYVAEVIILALYWMLGRLRAALFLASSFPFAGENRIAVQYVFDQLSSILITRQTFNTRAVVIV